MSIAVTCQACGSDFNVNERHAGKRFACRVCQAPVTVPADPRARASGAPQPARSGQSSRPVSHGNDPQAPTADRIVAACDGCGHRTSVGRELVGKRVRCKKCDQVFRIAAADAQPTSAPPQPARPAPVAPQDEWPVPPPIVNRATQPAPAQDGFNLADLLPGESAEAGIKLAPLAPLPERKHVPAPVAAESPSSEKHPWWDGLTSQSAKPLTAGGVLFTILLVVSRAAVRTPAIRDWLNDDRPNTKAAQTAPPPFKAPAIPSFDAPFQSPRAGSLNTSSRSLPSVTLSNARCTTPSGRTLFSREPIFSVDFQASSIGPSTGFYYWVISGGGRTAEQRQLHLGFSGTFSGSIFGATPAGGSYQTWVEYSEDMVSQRVKVSNVVDFQHVAPPPEPESPSVHPFERPTFPRPRGGVGFPPSH